LDCHILRKKCLIKDTIERKVEEMGNEEEDVSN